MNKQNVQKELTILDERLSQLLDAASDVMTERQNVILNYQRSLYGGKTRKEYLDFLNTWLPLQNGDVNIKIVRSGGYYFLASRKFENCELRVLCEKKLSDFTKAIDVVQGKKTRCFTKSTLPKKYLKDFEEIMSILNLYRLRPEDFENLGTQIVNAEFIR